MSPGYLAIHEPAFLAGARREPESLFGRAGPHYPQRLLLLADWGMSYNSSTTLDHALASARNSTSPVNVLYIGDYSYAGAGRAAWCWAVRANHLSLVGQAHRVWQ